MSSSPDSLSDLLVRPVTPERWRDLETLFSESKTCSSCWCMWFRLTRSQYQLQSGNGNKLAMREIVGSGEVPGLLAYVDGKPIGWCSVAPRETYPSLDRSRTLKRIDDAPVWSVVCFFVSRHFRGKGLMLKLLQAAVTYAGKHGATIVEGYPLDSDRGKMTNSAIYPGIASVFHEAGFEEVARRSARQAILRYRIR